MKLLSILATGLVIFAIGVEFTCIIAGSMTGQIDLDANQILTAAKSVANGGTGKIPFLVNSSAGLDVGSWLHVFTDYFYAWTGIYRLNLWQYSWVVGGELLVAAGLVLLLAKEIARFEERNCRLMFGTIVFLVVYDGIFRSFWIGEGRIYTRWAFIFASFSLFCLLRYQRGNRTSNLNKIFSAMGGGTAVLSFLAYASVGLAMAAGLLTAWLYEIVRRKERGAAIWFGAGSCTAAAFFSTVVFRGTGWQGLADIKSLLGYYSSFDARHYFLELGYDLVSVIVPWHGITLLPVGLLALAVLAFNYRKLSNLWQGLVRDGVIITVVWFLTALITEPSHYYPARLTWFLPLMIGMGMKVYISENIRGRKWFLGMVIVMVIAQMVFHVLLDGSGNGWLVVLSGSVIIGGGILTWTGKYTKHLNLNLTALVVMGILAVGSQIAVMERVEEIWRRYKYYQEGVRTENLVAATRNATQDLTKDGQWVLTNVPIEPFFSPSRQLQILLSKRGLVNGAREEAADILILMEIDGVTIGTQYPRLERDNLVGYRGFVYQITASRPLIKKHNLLVGYPVEKEVDEAVIWPAGRVEESELSDYFNWRMRKGLKLR